MHDHILVTTACRNLETWAISKDHWTAPRRSKLQGAILVKDGGVFLCVRSRVPCVCVNVFPMSSYVGQVVQQRGSRLSDGWFRKLSRISSSAWNLDGGADRRQKIYGKKTLISIYLKAKSFGHGCFHSTQLGSIQVSDCGVLSQFQSFPQLTFCEAYMV